MKTSFKFKKTEMKRNTILLLIIPLAIIASCSSNSNKIQDKWWYEVDNIGDNIIKFTSDNKLKNINDRAVSTYEINDQVIKMKVRDYEKELEVEYKELEKEMELENNSDNSTDLSDLSKEPLKLYKEEK